jgi:hypothetical protein
MTYIENKKIIKKSKWIFRITRQLYAIILVQSPHSDPLWKKHCMSNKKIISCFQYLVKKQYLQYPGNLIKPANPHWDGFQK